MSRILKVVALPILVVVLLLAGSSFFTVDFRQTALVLRFGEVVAVRSQPGLGVKVPVIDNVVKYDGRILGLSTEPMEITPADDRRLVVDAFARWRISDAVRFRRAVGNGGTAFAEQRLSGILVNAIRSVLGSVPSTAVLSDDRSVLMNKIRDASRTEAEALGVTVIDVRLTRTDLPQQNLEATYARMRAEREREAADERARGGEAAQRVRATADRTVVELTSDARRKAEVIRGEADGQRNAIYADAFGKDPEFFAFMRSMTAYERALDGATTSIVLRPDGEFFSYMRNDGGAAATPNAAAATAPSPAPSAGPAADRPADTPDADAAGATATDRPATTGAATPTTTAPAGDPS